MSAENQPQVQVPDQQKAAEIMNRLYQDVYFSKLAELGHQPTSPQDAESMLNIGLQLDLADQQLGQKQASAGESPVQRAERLLQEKLAELGLVTAPDPAAVIKQAALTVAQDPEVYGALLALQAAAESAA